MKNNEIFDHSQSCHQSLAKHGVLAFAGPHGFDCE
jgi:hypothetical protein